MVERSIDVSYETIRRGVDKFGSTYAKRIKSRSEPPSPGWHLDEVYTKINGKTRKDARQDVFDYIELFYNPKRRHANNGMLSSVEFEMATK